MKLFCATLNSQGLRKTDVCECNEGEWVMLPLSNSPSSTPEHLIGFKTLGATTTFRVIDLPVSTGLYLTELLNASMRMANQHVPPWDSLEEEACELVRLADGFHEHEILEFVEHGRIGVRKILSVVKIKP